MPRWSFRGLVLFVSLLGASGCPRAEPTGVDAPPGLRVFTLSYPAEWLAEQIGGPDVQVIDVRPEHNDPEVWRPTPENIFTIQDEASVVLVGGGFESWYRSKDFSPFSVFSLVDPLGRGLIKDPSGAPDPYLWLEPESYDLSGKGLADHLAARAPHRAPAFRERQEELSKSLAQLESELRSAARSVPPLFAARKGYAYAARALGWRLQHMAVSPVVRPDVSEVTRWRERMMSHPARHILFARAPEEEVHDALRSVGLAPVVLPLLTHREEEDRAASRDYPELFRRAVAHLVAETRATPSASR